MLDSGKWVSILRDPDEKLEVARTGGGLTLAAPALTAVRVHCVEAVGILAYLGGVRLAESF